MAQRANPTETETRLAQLEEDAATIARLLTRHAGLRPELLAIIERYAPVGLENRPHIAPEQRVA
jgi:hypothetical protein